MSQISMLYQLQLVDSERLRKRRALIDAESNLGETPGLQQARAMLVQEKTALSHWSGRLRDLDLKLKGLNGKIKSNEQRLYSGSVNNPKELQSLQADLAHLRRRRDKTEDGLLEAMTEVDDREALVSEARAVSAQIEEQWKEEQDRLHAIVSQLRDELGVLEERRRELRASIDEADLGLYDSLLRSKGGLAVTVLKGELCGGCRVRVPSGLAQRARQGKELVLCNNCGRILAGGYL